MQFTPHTPTCMRVIFGSVTWRMFCPLYSLCDQISLISVILFLYGAPSLLPTHVATTAVLRPAGSSSALQAEAGWLNLTCSLRL